MATVIDMSAAPFMEGEYRLRKIGEYKDGMPALELISVDVEDEDEEGVIVTISLAGCDTHAPKGHVFIKNYSENQGVLEPMVEAGILEVVEMIQPQGSFAKYPLCKVLVELNAL